MLETVVEVVLILDVDGVCSTQTQSLVTGFLSFTADLFCSPCKLSFHFPFNNPYNDAVKKRRHSVRL